MHFQISGNYSSLGSGLLTNQNNYAKMKAINDNIIEMYAIAEKGSAGLRCFSSLTNGSRMR